MSDTPPVVPVQAPGLIGNTYHPPGEVLPWEVIDGLRNRGPGVARPPLPTAGQIVGFRAVPAGPVVAAVVQAVESIADPWAHEHDAFEPHGPDPGVWHVALDPVTRRPRYDPLRPGQYVFELNPDPWPSVVLSVRPQPGEKRATLHTITREARRPGDAGWLPADQIGA